MTQEQQSYFDQLTPNHDDPAHRLDVYVPLMVEDKILIDGNKRHHVNQNDRIQHIDAVGKNVFEVGGNTGYIAFRLAEQGANHVLSIDLKHNLIELCNKIKEVDNVTNVDFLQLNKVDLQKQDCSIRNHPNFKFDVGLLMSNWHYDLCIDELNQYGDYASVWYVEPTNHDPHYRTEEEIMDWGMNELSQFGKVEFLTYTDYQHRGMFKVTMNG